MAAIIFLPVAIALIYVLSAKKGLYVSTLICCLSFAVGFIMYALAVQASTGSDIFTYYKTSMDSFLEQNELLTRTSYALLNGTADIAGVSFDEALPVVQAYMGEQLMYFLPAFATGVSTIGGLVVYLIVRAIAKAFGANVVKIPPFSEFFLPRHFGRYSVICYIIVAVGNNVGWRGFDFVFAIVSVLLGCIYYVQGLCFLDFMMKYKIKSAALRVLILAVITLILYQVFIFIGLFEQLFKFRKRILAARSEQA